MSLDMTHFFSEYERLVAQIDTVFLKVATTHPQEVRCQQGCSDCCHALFDVPLIEAMYLNSKLSSLSDSQKNEVLIEADKYDRKAQVLKKKAFKAVSENVSSQEVLAQVAVERLRCPLLGPMDQCLLYQYRPITCRLYGIPTEIGGKSHSCGLSGFAPGLPYPAVKLEKIQDMLVLLSQQLLETIGSKYDDFRTMLVPVSAALMTDFSEDFFGLASDKDASTQKSGEPHA